MERALPLVRRYRCPSARCGWRGLLEMPRPAPVVDPVATARARPTRRAVAIATLAGVTGVAAAGGWLLHRPPPDERVMVGRHVVLRGTHLEGERLPPAHPLTRELPAALLDGEPEGFSETPEALLRAKRNCAWGMPGRNPYRGSAIQALQTAQLSPTVVHRMAADIRAGRKADRVTVSNDGIVALRSGRVFDPRHVAMTYGMTMCVDTRVNFKPGHSESADLYEAMDDDGRIYAVMVPDVCGNVSVLGQRYVRDAAPSAADTRPWMRLPPELRPRMLPDKLRFTDDRDPKDKDPDDEDHKVPEPATPWLLGLGLAALVAAGRARRRA